MQYLWAALALFLPLTLCSSVVHAGDVVIVQTPPPGFETTVVVRSDSDTTIIIESDARPARPAQPVVVYQPTPVVSFRPPVVYVAPPVRATGYVSYGPRYTTRPYVYGSVYVGASYQTPRRPPHHGPHHVSRGHHSRHRHH